MTTWRRIRTGVLVAACATCVTGLAACGGPDLAIPSTDTEVEVTDYATLPPPTTTIPPTTTLPPQPGSVLTSEATYVVVAVMPMMPP